METLCSRLLRHGCRAPTETVSHLTPLGTDTLVARVPSPALDAQTVCVARPPGNQTSALVDRRSIGAAMAGAHRNASTNQPRIPRCNFNGVTTTYKDPRPTRSTTPRNEIVVTSIPWLK